MLNGNGICWTGVFGFAGRANTKELSTAETARTRGGGAGA